VNRVWIVLAGFSAACAAVLLWLGHSDVAFVVATIGVVAWFINYRTKLKEVTTAAQAENSEGGEPEESDEN
jgi:hypothetical protein